MDISRFLKVYANVPVALRDQIIVIVDDRPLTWNAAYIELISETELGKRIQEKLIEMEII